MRVRFLQRFVDKGGAAYMPGMVTAPPFRTKTVEQLLAEGTVELVSEEEAQHGGEAPADHPAVAALDAPPVDRMVARNRGPVKK